MAGEKRQERSVPSHQLTSLRLHASFSGFSCLGNGSTATVGGIPFRLPEDCSRRGSHGNSAGYELLPSPPQSRGFLQSSLGAEEVIGKADHKLFSLVTHFLLSNPFCLIQACMLVEDLHFCSSETVEIPNR